MNAPPASSGTTPAPVTAAQMQANVRRRGHRLIASLLRILLAVYVLMCLLLYFTQEKLLFPGQESQGKVSAQVVPPTGSTLAKLKTPAGVTVTALFGPALTPDGQPLHDAARRPTVLYFYGNGMCLNDARDDFQAFRKLGVNVLIPDYCGYGMSGGRASESGCYATAEAAYDYLLTRRDVDPHRIVAAGWSLGGAVAIDLASRKPVAGLAAFCTFTSMRAMAHRLFPFLPVSLLLRHHFDSESKMPRVSCPILIGHARHDSVVPFAMAAQLAAAAQAPVTSFTVETGDHVDFWGRGNSPARIAFADFLHHL